MNFTLTLDKILELPNDLLKTAEKYDEYSELLRKKIYNEYDSKELKEKIVKKFERFKDAKYLYRYPIESCIKTTPTYQLREGMIPKQVSSKIEKVITQRVDDQMWAGCFYDTLMIVATKLTMQEAIYLVDSFFGNKSEDVIAEKLAICRTTLQNIKKSCLVKVWIELKTLDGEDD